jgi:uncharacterized protein YegL
MAKQGLTEIVCILDRSGSMNSIKQDAIGGFNTFLESQQKLDGKATMTVVQFDNEYMVTVDGVDIQDVTPLNNQTFVPRGSTALLDAIGRTVNEVGSRLEGMLEGNRPEKVIVLILTDGQENGSHEFNRAQINSMITVQKETYSWEFIFLAAGQDAMAEAHSIGIGQLNTMSFTANAKGMSTTYSAMNDVVSMYRSAGTIDASWKDV